MTAMGTPPTQPSKHQENANAKGTKDGVAARPTLQMNAWNMQQEATVSAVDSPLAMPAWLSEPTEVVKRKLLARDNRFKPKQKAKQRTEEQAACSIRSSLRANGRATLDSISTPLNQMARTPQISQATPPWKYDGCRSIGITEGIEAEPDYCTAKSNSTCTTISTHSGVSDAGCSDGAHEDFTTQEDLAGSRLISSTIPPACTSCPVSQPIPTFVWREPCYLPVKQDVIETASAHIMERALQLGTPLKVDPEKLATFKHLFFSSER